MGGQIEKVLYIRREKKRNVQSPKSEITLMIGRCGDASVVVTANQESATLRSGAGKIPVAEDVTATVYARALAIPHREYALIARSGKELELLRPPDGIGRKFLVDSRNEDRMSGGEMSSRSPQLLV
jgi:hypothetical protein